MAAEKEIEQKKYIKKIASPSTNKKAAKKKTKPKIVSKEKPSLLAKEQSKPLEKLPDVKLSPIGNKVVC